MYGLSGRQFEQTEGKSEDSHPDRLMSALSAPVGGIMDVSFIWAVVESVWIGGCCCGERNY